jgi:hypothetical protein
MKIARTRYVIEHASCSSCGAECDKPCTTRNGNVMSRVHGFHTPRLTAAEAYAQAHSEEIPIG